MRRLAKSLTSTCIICLSERNYWLGCEDNLSEVILLWTHAVRPYLFLPMPGVGVGLSSVYLAGREPTRAACGSLCHGAGLRLFTR